MEKMKKILAMVLSVALLFSGMIFDNTLTKADETNTWSGEAIISPEQNKLIGAGYIDIKWNNTLENVKQYKVYIDGTLKKDNVTIRGHYEI